MTFSFTCVCNLPLVYPTLDGSLSLVTRSFSWSIAGELCYRVIFFLFAYVICVWYLRVRVVVLRAWFFLSVMAAFISVLFRGVFVDIAFWCLFFTDGLVSPGKAFMCMCVYVVYAQPPSPSLTIFLSLYSIIFPSYLWDISIYRGFPCYSTSVCVLWPIRPPTTARKSLSLIMFIVNSPFLKFAKCVCSTRGASRWLVCLVRVQVS